MSDEIGQISYSALHNLAYEKIIRAIRSGRYQPGDALRTRTLAKALGVSSTPVREALSRLIAQNALDVDPRNRIAMIPPVTRELLEEMYDVRLLLEGHAAELAAKRITARELAKLHKLADRLSQREADGSVTDPAYLELSQDFCFSVYYAARQPLLVSLIDSLWLRSSVILSLLHRQRPAGFSLREARHALLDALDRRDGRMARKSIHELLTSTREMVLEALSRAYDEIEAGDAPAPKSSRVRRPAKRTLDAAPERTKAKRKQQGAGGKNKRRGQRQ
ncbi:MAG: GntR family transcriptional regulator [Sphingomonas sp.]